MSSLDLKFLHNIQIYLAIIRFNLRRFRALFAGFAKILLGRLSLLRCARNCKQRSSLRKILPTQPQKSLRNTCKFYFNRRLNLRLKSRIRLAVLINLKPNLQDLLSQKTLTLLCEQNRIAAFNFALLATKRRFAVSTKALHGEN